MTCTGSSYSVSHSIPYQAIDIQFIDLAVVCGSECVSLKRHVAMYIPQMTGT